MWRAALLIGALSLAACETPLTARGESARAITQALGAPIMPLDSGVYRLIHEGPAPEGSILEAADAVVDGSERPLFTDLMIVRLHSASRSYVTSYGNFRLYPFDGDILVMEHFADDDEAIYVPARAEEGAEALTLFEYNCTAFPEAERAGIGLTDRCRITDVDVLRRALARLDVSTLTPLRLVRDGPLPDRQ